MLAEIGFGNGWLVILLDKIGFKSGKMGNSNRDAIFEGEVECRRTSSLIQGRMFI